MEEYEKFCEKSLSRIQKASLSTESFLPVQSENISLIRFHGVAVLSPLLNIEKRKEMQQEKQKALDVEARKQVNRKKALLTRVQEILENVQVRKAPNASDFDQWEDETVYSNSEVRNLNVPATFPNTLPSSTEHSTLAKFEKITGILPLNNEDQFKSNGIDLARDSEKFNFLKQGSSSNIGCIENEASLKTSATPQETLISGGLLPKNEEQDPSLLEEVTPDPYLMSLQNLMKKSKEYIEKEQSRRSLRNSANGSVNESHSDKENDAVKVTDCVKEKTQFMGKHCSSVIPDKPSLNKSNVLLQGASAQASSMNTAVSENYPYVITAEQERQHLPEKICPTGSVYINKNKMLESISREDEEILKSKMLAFEEMRKRLEEQHAQQLSLLIAEQEREQERLQKEIEEQEKMFKEKKVITAEASELDINSTVDLEWRKISDSSLLETMLSQMDSLHTSNSNSSGFTNSALQHSFGSVNEAPFYLWGSSTSGLTKPSVTRPSVRATTKWSQAFSPEVQAKFNRITAVAKGFLTRRLMETDKLKQLRQTVKDTMEFIRSFQSEAPLKRGVVSAQDASLQERVLAQLRAALYGIHDIFFVMDAAERMSILHHDREARKEKMLRQMDKMKSSRVSLSAATQKSLDRKKYMKAAEMGMPNKKFLVKQNPSEARVLQPNQGQNAPVHRLLSRQGTPKTSLKGVVQNRQKSSQSRVPNRAPVSGVYAGKIQRKRPNVATI
ncbi:Centriolar coiled-coil protein of 110 kDa [Myotis davidii]|uniref:Centriolar coiled-coil protein of 110 kDa n=1 Tax=Myotis davidii TaxID=225400 RepID=L5MCB3_MYODS|nr:Centriolar coiled-coil protein of 110 kDa [Myotis davidii]